MKMNTTEDFENAPIGATATAPNGDIAINTGKYAFDWALCDSHGRLYGLLRSDEIEGFTLNPVAPTTAREALELAWELAHPMKEGHEVPIGTECIAKVREGEFLAYRSLKRFDGVSRPGWAEARTLDPLPEPLPDWLDAPAILASYPLCADTEQVGIWIPSDKDGRWEWPLQEGEFTAHWSELENVTPLYPKETDE